LACSPGGVQSRLDVLVTCDVPAGKACGRVVRRCPALLFARDPKEMSSVAEALCGFFSRKEVAGVVQAAPEVLLKNIEELEEKYEYIFFQMCIEGDEFKECMKWPAMSLEEIMTRHEFLLKTGRYTTPDPKHPQKKMVAGVTREEWTVYRAFSEQLSNRSGGEERPYERVKPSKRKAYERRRKEAKTPENHSIYTALTASQLQSCGSSAAASGTGPANTLAMGNRPALDVAALVDRAMSIDEHLQSMPMPMTGWNDHQFRSQEVGK
uniref:DIOX_N domain-containing protein n=1 Tax=Heligmosomoides polygyrus TaxID=6339 RepID=A0A8L8KKU4_HELPZ